MFIRIFATAEWKFVYANVIWLAVIEQAPLATMCNPSVEDIYINQESLGKGWGFSAETLG